MMNINMKNMMVSGQNEDKHMRHRRIATPGRSRNAATTMRRKFSYNPVFTLWVYLRNILFWMIPALLLHAPLIIIKTADSLITGNALTIPGENIYLLLIYGIPFLLGLRRGSDQMAYYNIHAVLGKENLNYQVQSVMANSGTKSKEFKKLDGYRKRFNRISLFPTTKELAVEEQLYQRALKSHLQNAIAAAEQRRAALDLGNKEMEHFAAKDIADQKQQETGGKNEYDEMVARYKHRAAPQIKEIIARVQNSY